MENVIVIPIKCSVVRKITHYIEDIMVYTAIVYGVVTTIWVMGALLKIFPSTTGNWLLDLGIAVATTLGVTGFIVVSVSIVIEGIKCLLKRIPTFKCIEDEKEDTKTMVKTDD